VWWEQFHDPVLSKLVETAESSSPTIEVALARVEEARSDVTRARAGLFPSVQANASSTRSNAIQTGSSPTALTPGTTTTAALDASWELDLFGGVRRGLEGSRARLDSYVASWHDARVTLGANTADAYVNLRYCQVLVGIAESDLISRRATQRLTRLKVNAGFSAPADGSRTDANVAEGEGALENQRSICARGFNQLVALTGLTPAALREVLGASTAERGIPVPEIADVSSIPADVLSQRPDLRNAERLVAAASADIGVAIAKRYPQLSLSGEIGVTRLAVGGASLLTHTWSFGPALMLPLFDAGALAAGVTGARARYDQAAATYRGKVRTAVQEVEDALVRINAAALRQAQANIAVEEYGRYLRAVNTSFQLGSASLLELEEARRLLFASNQTLAATQLERSAAWITLYKAAGGGWQTPDSTKGQGQQNQQQALLK
jgi:NodT family efflux transporter outer membrane factor (OMF) lipoprotein